MPIRSRELSAIAVSNLKAVRTPNGLRTRFMVGGAVGLHMKAMPNGARSWILRVTIDEKRRDIGLGSYPGVTLATARKLANDYHDRLAQGIDPFAERRAKTDATRAAKAKVKTFREVAEAYVDAHKGEWKNAKHAAQWRATLAQHAYSKIGATSVAAIETAHKRIGHRLRPFIVR